MVGAPSLAQDAVSSYRISLRRSGEGEDATWLAEIEELPDCSAHGATPEEAVQRVWAAANGASPQGKGGSGDAPSPVRPKHSGRLLVRMPASLHDELARTAEGEGVSLNQLITSALASAVGWRKGQPALQSGAEWKSGDEAEGGSPSILDRVSTGRATRIALAANFALVLVAAVAAIALLVVAWNGT